MLMLKHSVEWLLSKDTIFSLILVVYLQATSQLQLPHAHIEISHLTTNDVFIYL